ncbi:galanin receptor type 2-like [Actinia tenebrosa]|uniref:Galanin receptor type 2-like n=1 Tax=Actinia tenebrosa TaxID=6105 RepID=A0A6P8I991_ACTTE|nr:galanin receptor type 2-like [Actinia tenebrosa]
MAGFNVWNNSTTSPPGSTQDTTADEDRCIMPFVHGIPIVIINSTLVFVGTFGNFLIISSVLSTHRLRRRISNFLLVSLAFADLFVTICAQPLHATSVAFKTFRNCCVVNVDWAYDVTVNFSLFCSLFHLSAISIDRALVVTKPHKHQEIMKKYGLRTMLIACWGMALVFVCIRVPFRSTLMLSIALIVFNFLFILICYTVILYQLTREKVNSNDPAAAMSSASRDARTEKRVAGTIAIIIFFFSLCWFPLLGFYISVGKAVLRELGGVTYMWIRTAVLSNSSMNFIVYSWRIDIFRKAYLKTVNKMLHRPRQFFRIAKLNASVGLSQVSKDNDKVMELTGDLEKSQSYSRDPQSTAMTSCATRRKEGDSKKGARRKSKVAINNTHAKISSRIKPGKSCRKMDVEVEGEISYSNFIISNPVIILANKTTVNENHEC